MSVMSYAARPEANPEARAADSATSFLASASAEHVVKREANPFLKHIEDHTSGGPDEGAPRSGK